MGNPLAYKLLSGTSPTWDVLYKLALITATGNTTITLSGANTDADSGALLFVQGGSGSYTLNISGWSSDIPVQGAVGAQTLIEWAYIGGTLHVKSDYITGSSLTQLATPGSFSASPASSSQINLTWSDVSNESNYEIQRSTDNATWSTINSPAAGSTSYNNTGLSIATLYYYRIKAIGDGTTYSDSAWATASATTDSASLLVEDTFNDTNTSDITGRTTTTGSEVWTSVDWTGGGTTGRMGIEGNACSATTSDYLQMERAYLLDYARNIDLRMTTHTYLGTGGGVYLLLAYSNSSNYLQIHTGTGTVYQTVSGSTTTLYTGSSTPANGDVFRAVLNGTSLSVYRGVTLITTQTVSAALTGTQAGFLNYHDEVYSIESIAIYSV